MADLPMHVTWCSPYETGRGRNRRMHSPTVVVRCEDLYVWNQHWKLDRAVSIGVRLERQPQKVRRGRRPGPIVYAGRQDDGPWERLFGIPGRDKVLQVLAKKDHVGVESRGKIRWLVPNRRLPRFLYSRKRDKFQVVDLKSSPALEALVSSFETKTDDRHRVVGFEWPETTSPPLAVYQCRGCGLSGSRSEFLTRRLAGLASSVGIDCPRCKPRDIGAAGLVFGSPKGKVQLADEQPCLAPAIGPDGPDRYS